MSLIHPVQRFQHSASPSMSNPKVKDGDKSKKGDKTKEPVPVPDPVDVCTSGPQPLYVTYSVTYMP
jgi:hypothetical protein